MAENNARTWYVLRSSKSSVQTTKSIEDEMYRRQKLNDTKHPKLEYYLPKFVTVADANGRNLVEKPLCLNYMFLHSTLNEALDFRKACPDLSILKDGRSDESNTHYACITDDKMRMFMVMVRAYKDKVPLCNPSSVNLNVGDTVRIIGGDFNGVEGELVTKQGADGGMVILRVTNGLLVPTLRIDSRYLQVLSFGKADGRYYNLFGRYSKKIRMVMRESLSADIITDKNRITLEKFISQFGNTEIPQKNFRVRYDALLMMAHSILRHPEKATAYIYKCDSTLKSLTDNMAKLEIVVALFACTGKRSYAELARSLTDKWDTNNLKGKKKELIDDLSYYGNHADNIRKVKDFEPLEMLKAVVSISSDSMPSGRGGFVTFASGYINDLKRNGKILQAERNAKVIRKFSKYLENGDIAFSNFVRETVEGYRNWLTQSGLAENSIRFYIRNLSCLYNYAIDRGLCPKESPFKNVKLSSQKNTQTTEHDVITIEDFRRLNSLDLTSYGKPYSLARDIFSFSVYALGMRPINILFLKRSDISEGRLTYAVHTAKGQEQTSIEWNSRLQKISDRYNQSAPYLFPCITASNYEMAISQYHSALKTINRNLAKLGKLLGLPFPLSMNVASYSWKSIIAELGADEI